MEDCQAEASKGTGELLLTASRRRKEGCGGGQPKEDGKERRGLVLCREEHPARCCSRVVHTNGRCGTQTEPARNWRSSDLVRCVESSKDMEVRIGARRAPHRFPCERATKAVSTVHSESTRRNDDTPDLNEPLNTNHRGGGREFVSDSVCRIDSLVQKERRRGRSGREVSDH